MTFTPPLGRREIEQILPHRDPFLLLDEVVELEPGARVVARKLVREDEWYLAGHFPGRPIMPGVLMVEAMAQAGAVAVLSAEENRGKLALFAGIDDVRFKRIVEPGDELELTCELERVRGPDRPRQGDRHRRRRARRARDADVRRHGRGGRVIASVSGNGIAVGITGIGAYVPERGAHERRPRAHGGHVGRVDRRRAPGSGSGASPSPAQAASDLALPAARQALEQAGVDPEELDLVIVATATPDMLFPATAAIVADALGATQAAAYDLLAGCTGFVYALAQAYGQVASGLSKRALVVGAEALSRITNWQDRSTCILFGDGAGAAVVEPVADGRHRSASSSARTAPAARTSACRPAARASRSPPRARGGAAVHPDERRRGVPLRDARDGQLGRGAAGGLRRDGRRRRPVRPAPGEQADHRPRGEESRASTRRRC